MSSRHLDLHRTFTVALVIWIARAATPAMGDTTLLVDTIDDDSSAVS